MGVWSRGELRLNDSDLLNEFVVSWGLGSLPAAPSQAHPGLHESRNTLVLTEGSGAVL
jgi:hypothetical protein